MEFTAGKWAEIVEIIPEDNDAVNDADYDCDNDAMMTMIKMIQFKSFDFM